MVKFDQLPDSGQYLTNIIINKDARKSLTEQLRKYGLTNAQLFPEIGSIANEIKEEGY